MAKVKDLSGKTFGRMTVLELSHMNERGHAMWRCQCSCADKTIKVVRGSHLTDGNITSCGCYAKEKQTERHAANRQHFIGKTFGRLTVLELSHIDNLGHAMFKCQCSCDKASITTVRSGHLTDGNVTSCGCVLHEAIMNRHDSHRASMIGKVFGKLTVIDVDRIENSHTTYYQCRCGCGNLCSVSNIHLIDGNTTSCGCYQKEVSSVIHSTHGLSLHPLYGTWRCMLDRCYNPESTAFHNYGGRDPTESPPIDVCEEWQDDPRLFMEWADTHGYEPGLTLERIDNNKGYGPNNCRYATRTEQARNKRTNVITGMEMAEAIRNDDRSPAEIAEHYGISRAVVYDVKNGKTWNPDD